MIAVRMCNDVFSNTASVQEPSKTPTGPGKSGVDHDIAVVAFDYDSVEQPAWKQRASMNPIGDLAELGSHQTT